MTFWVFTSLSGFTANPFLAWRDFPDGRRYRIDIARQQMEVEMAPGRWFRIGSVTVRGVFASDLPPNAHVVPQYSSDSVRLLLLDCTQQLLKFNFKSRMLERLDKTYFRGYNCEAIRFLRHDTLYAFGGAGFWRSNNLLTYYKSGEKEWESILHVGSGPVSIWRGANCYLPDQDVFFSSLNHHFSDSDASGRKHYSNEVFTYSFSENKWKLLGHLTKRLQMELNFDWATESNILWTGKLFVMRRFKELPNRFFLIDPVKNEVRVWDDAQKTITNSTLENHPNFYWGDSLYFFRYPHTTEETGIQRVALSLTQIWKEATPIGVFYENTERGDSLNRLWIGFVIALLLMGGGVILWKWHKRPLPIAIGLKADPNGLDEHFDKTEKGVLRAMVSAHSLGGLTGEQLSELLSVSKKMPDHQRRVRSEVISSINTKLFFAVGVQEGIERIPTALDKRMYSYKLKEDCYFWLNALSTQGKLSERTPS